MTRLLLLIPAVALAFGGAALARAPQRSMYDAAFSKGGGVVRDERTAVRLCDVYLGSILSEPARGEFRTPAARRVGKAWVGRASAVLSPLGEDALQEPLYIVLDARTGAFVLARLRSEPTAKEITRLLK